MRKRVMHGDGILILASLVLAAAVAALWLYMAGLQTGRKPGSDAVFRNLYRKDEGFAKQEDRKAEGI